MKSDFLLLQYKIDISRKKRTDTENENDPSTQSSEEALRDLCRAEVLRERAHALATSPCPYTQHLWHPQARVDTPASASDFSVQQGYFKGA